MRLKWAVAGTILVISMLAFNPARAAETPGRLRHVVCLKFKEDAKPEDIKKSENAFRDLKNKLNVVLSLEWGTNVSKENRAKGFTHCFFLTFVDEKDLDTYAKSAEHLNFVKTFLVPIMDDVFVIDYHAKE